MSLNYHPLSPAHAPLSMYSEIEASIPDEKTEDICNRFTYRGVKVIYACLLDVKFSSMSFSVSLQRKVGIIFMHRRGKSMFIAS